MILKVLEKEKLISPPNWLTSNIIYLVTSGSYSYGVSDSLSDHDVVGITIPPRDIVFPHSVGYVGFGKSPGDFGQWQKHHVNYDNKEYDFTIYSIIRYFNLCAVCNPNMIDTLFVPRHCILNITQIGELIRENRKLFLSKKAFSSFKGYAFSQMFKINNKKPKGERKELIEKYNFDVKYAYHLVRLLYEIEQILDEGDLDLQLNKEHLKQIRNGEVSLDEINNIFSFKEKELETKYNKSLLPNEPDEKKINDVLLRCLEMHFGSIDKFVNNPNLSDNCMNEIRKIVDKWKLSEG